jgi:hypothetical protein
LSNTVIIESITPNVCRVTSQELGLILGLPLIYAAIQKVSTYDNEYVLLPTNLRERILQNLFRVSGYNTTEEMGQLVERIPILVSSSSDDGGLSFVDLDSSITGDTMREQAVTTTAMQNFMQVTAANQARMMVRMEEHAISTRRAFEGLQMETRRNHENVIRHVKRIALVPAVRNSSREIGEGDLETQRPSRPAVLSKKPADLYVLWREYEFGIGNNKAARDFTAHERGIVTVKYSFRNNFWALVDEMIRRGASSYTAIDRIYEVYGRNQCVSKILRAIRTDKARGGHPNLC